MILTNYGSWRKNCTTLQRSLKVSLRGSIEKKTVQEYF